MTSDSTPPEPEGEPELPPFIIEGARSARAKCKTCRRTIDRGVLRLGVRIEGPFGAGHLWHHLKCAARRRFEEVEQAYAVEAWRFAKEPPEDVPPLEELAKLREETEKRKAEKRELPYAELAPSGRARCKLCDEPIEKGHARVVIGRAVQFGQQTRTTPIHVHPACVAHALHAEDCATEIEGFAEALRAHSTVLAPETIDAILGEVGEILY